MKHLFVAAAVAPLCFAADAALAQTTIDKTTTAPLVTSTAGTIDVAVGGAINPIVPGAAITVDSNNNVTIEGQVLSRDQPTGTGVLIETGTAGLTSNFTMASGVLRADDSYVAKDTDGDGNLDGPFVPPTSGATLAPGDTDGTPLRYALRVTGTGTYTGDIIETGGIIAIDGNGLIDGARSAAVSIEAPVVGNITLTGQIGTLGTNSYGVATTASVTGVINIGGTLSSIGSGATAVSIGGDVTGHILFNGSITNTGYRYPTRPTLQTVVDKLGADDLLQGGVGIQISKSVTGGVWFYQVITDTDATNTDEDNDGIADTLETTSFSITQSAAAPAIIIGGADNIVLGNNGTATNNSYGLIIGGTVDALGIYDNIEAHGVVIGGQGGAVSTSSGISVIGTVLASSIYANAVAMEFGTKATAPVLNNAGTISAGALGLATDTIANGGPTLYALKIDGDTTSGSGDAASLSTLINSGTIRAGLNGTYGHVYAISDQSGSLSSVTNYGTISAAITTGSTDVAPVGQVVAMDLSHNTSGVTISQQQNPDTTITTIPSILGDVLLGSGNDDLEIGAGTVLGAVSFGGGANNLNVGATATVTGAITTTGTLTVTNNGTLAFTNSDVVQLASLTTGATSTTLFTVNPASGSAAATELDVAGTATLAEGASVSVGFKSKLAIDAGTTDLTLISAGTLVNNGLNTSLVDKIPFLYSGQLTVVGNDLDLAVTRKTAAEAGLEGASAAAFEAFYNNFDKDSSVAGIVLSKTDQASFDKLYNQFLPDYSGGVFNSMAAGVRAIQRTQAEPAVDMDQSEPRSWLQEVGFGVSQTSTTDAVGYQTAGFALAGGYEQPAGKLGTVGYSMALLTSDIQDDNRAFGSKLSASSVVGSFYWRKAAGGLLLDASATGAGAWFESSRRVVDADAAGDQNLIRTADANYYGGMAGVRLGASYQVKLGHFYIKPEALVDYLYLYQSGYSEAGGGAAVDLQVDGRGSSNATAEAGLIIGAQFGRSFHWGPELQIAYRSTIGGSLGDTKAAFLASPTGSFLLPSLPFNNHSTVVRLALKGTGAYANFSLEGSGEFGDLYDEYTGRLVVRFIF